MRRYELAGYASIKVAILYKIFAQNPKMWRNAPKMAGGFKRFL